MYMHIFNLYIILKEFEFRMEEMNYSTLILLADEH